MSRGHEKDKDKEDSSLLDVEKLESRISDGGAARKGGAKGPPRPATQETRARNATLCALIEQGPKERGWWRGRGCVFSSDNRLMPTLGSSGPSFLPL